MVDADDKNNPPTDGQTDQSKGKDKLAETLASVQEQLRAMNEANQATQQAILQMRQAQVQPKETDDDLYDPKTLLNKAGDIMQRQLREERAKNAMIYNLGQEYPEIHSDSVVRQAVIEAQKGLRADLQDTADGYEVAVLKAVAKHGIMPKSKRQVVDDDASSAPRSGQSSGPRKKIKVSEDTKTIASLMGLNTEDSETMKNLEKNTNRDTYNKYRPVGGSQ